jgi:AcrR family transcriptional regulator
LATTDTKEQILDTAERLFADRGFDATSLRTITCEADVNLAAVHYHFGSKEALIEAVLARRFAALNRERLERLEACEHEAAPGPPELECVLRAFIEPAFELSRDPDRGGDVFMRLVGHAHSAPGQYLVRLFKERFADFVARFVGAVGRALPGLPAADLHWHLHFMIGAMAHTMAHRERLRDFSNGILDPTDTAEATERLVAFVAAGMRDAALRNARGRKAS